MKKRLNHKGNSSIEVILLISVAIFVAVVLFSSKEGITELFGVDESVEAEQISVQAEAALNAFDQLDKDAFVFLGDAGFMTTDEKQIAGSELLSQIDLLLTQAESAEMTDTVMMLKDYQSKIESELNYGV